MQTLELQTTLPLIMYPLFFGSFVDPLYIYKCKMKTKNSNYHLIFKFRNNFVNFS